MFWWNVYQSALNLPCPEKFLLVRLSTSGKLLFHVQIARFQLPHTVRKYFTSAFPVFYTRTRSSPFEGSYSKVFIYLKSLKMIREEVINNEVQLGDVNLQVHEKNSFTHPLSCICLHFLRRHHNYFFRRGWKCSCTIFFRKYTRSVTCNLPVILIHSGQLSSYSIWRSFDYSFCQINRNSSFLAI